MVAKATDGTTHSGGGPAREARGVCDHCGDSLAGLRVVERALGGQSMSYCCLGCAFIAEQVFIADAEAPRPAQQAASRPRAAPGTPPAWAQLEVGGMVCAACALLIEQRLRRTDGVQSAHVDFVARRALLVYEPERTDLTALRRVIERTGYRVDAGTPAQQRRRARVELLRVMVAWLAMMQVMMLAVPGYLARAGEIQPGIEQLLRLGQLVLTVPVLLFSAAPLLRAAASQLRMAAIGMDVPVALGLGGATLASVWATVAGRGPVYFDSVTMFVALLLSVRVWQQHALGRAAGHVDAAARQTRLTAHRLRAHPHSTAFDEVDAESLTPGDLVAVPAGAAVPADGRIVEGATTLSQAWLTGESAAIEKIDGDVVLAGSLNLDQPVVVEVTRAGDATSLAALRRLVVDAASRRPRVVELANRVAARFVAAVLSLAALTVVAWLLTDPAQAWPSAIAVLVVTCPCALSLAAPLAIALAQSTLARHGVLVARAAALETLARADMVAFDKTGTLTESAPVLLGITSLRGTDEGACLAIAASLEARSTHPFARALDAAARAAAVGLAPVTSLTELPGTGVEASIEGRRYRLGKADYALALMHDPGAGSAALSVLARRPEAPGSSAIVLADERGPLALLAFGERVREDARELIGALAARGATVAVVSGDQRAPVERVARELAAPGAAAPDTYANLTPAGKRALLAQWQGRGRTVAMIGDGINDAPVIAQADVSIALASGSDLAQARADFIVLDPRLRSVRVAFEVSRRSMRVIRQNLAWAVGYNLVMMPLAALGIISPAVAAAGMAASSVFVLANSWRLRRAGGRKPDAPG
ncbi:MAG TPA: cation-translocating P-type ATPase [Burkholderiaceae bacterium]